MRFGGAASDLKSVAANGLIDLGLAIMSSDYDEAGIIFSSARCGPHFTRIDLCRPPVSAGAENNFPLHHNHCS